AAGAPQAGTRRAAGAALACPRGATASGSVGQQLERRVGEVEVLRRFLRDQHRRDDRLGGQLLALQARLGGELDRVVHELRRVRDVGLEARVGAVLDRLYHAFRSCAAELDLDVGV